MPELGLFGKFDRSGFEAVTFSLTRARAVINGAFSRSASKHFCRNGFDACIVSKLVYGLHTATLNKSERSRLDGFNARCLRYHCPIIAGFPTTPCLNKPVPCHSASVFCKDSCCTWGKSREEMQKTQFGVLFSYLGRLTPFL